MKTSYFGVDSDKCNMGEKLPALWDAFIPRIGEIARAGPSVGYGIVRPRPGAEVLDYYACVEVDAGARAPRGMTSISVPPATYAVFEHRGLPRDLHATVSYVYGSWLLRAGYRHTYGPDLETYGEDFAPDSPESVIRYALPVRRA